MKIQTTAMRHPSFQLVRKSEDETDADADVMSLSRRIPRTSDRNCTSNMQGEAEASERPSQPSARFLPSFLPFFIRAFRYVIAVLPAYVLSVLTCKLAISRPPSPAPIQAILTPSCVMGIMAIDRSIWGSRREGEKKKRNTDPPAYSDTLSNLQKVSL